MDLAAKMFKDFKYGWLTYEFTTRLPHELNFLEEAENAYTCRKKKKNDPRVCVPKIYHDFSTERLLVMSYEEGIPVTKLKRI